MSLTLARAAACANNAFSRQPSFGGGPAAPKPCKHGELQDKLRLSALLKFKKVKSERVPDDAWASVVPFKNRKITVRNARLFGHVPIIDGYHRDEIAELLPQIFAEYAITAPEIDAHCITERMWGEVNGMLNLLINGDTDVHVLDGRKFDPMKLKNSVAPDEWSNLSPLIGLTMYVEEKVAKLIVDFNKRYAVIDADDDVKVYDRETGNRYDLAAFNKHRVDKIKVTERAANGDATTKIKQKTKLWFENPFRTTYVGSGLYPLGKNSDGSDYQDNDKTRLHFNKWQGWGIEAHKGSYPSFESHIRNIVCRDNKEHTAYLIDWFAHRVQKPWQKPRVAPVVWGPKQTGKSLVADQFRRIAGVHGTIVEKEGHITNRFADLTKYVFVQVEEALYSGDPRLANITKHALTSATQRIEEKHGAEYDAPSYTGYFFTSNSERAVAATSDEERFFVLNVSDEMKGQKEYFSDIIDEMTKRGGCGAWLYDLQRRDISNFDPWNLPFTSAFGEMVLANLQGFEKAIVEAVREGCITIRGVGGVIDRQIPWLNKPFAIEAEDLWQAFGKSVREYGEDHGSRVKIGTALNKLDLVINKVETDSSRGIKAQYILTSLDDARMVLAMRYNVSEEMLGGGRRRRASEVETHRIECMAELDALCTRLGLMRDDPHRLAIKSLIDDRFGR